MSAKEAKARIKINKLLEEAGWRFFDSAEGKANIFLEHRTKKGKISGDTLGNDSTTLLPNFFWLFCQSSDYWNQANLLASGAGQPQFNANALKQIIVPLPPLETQQKIVAELEEDLAVVAGAKRLKAKMEANIRATIGRVWGEDA
jgi:hypothetical protein